MTAKPTTASAPLIHKLDTRLINQIAAGEVIVRPASAVKELIENSLDAGAKRIELSVEEDVRAFTIRDDGCGMSEADARLSIERYATSKITDFEDLQRLTTRGFRGEALAAISSVSRFEILTRRAADESGTSLKSEGGSPARVTSAGLPEGTTIHVRDLFYNTPARMKFLRAPVSEWGHILKATLCQALTRPDVGFSIKWRGKPYLTLPPDQTLAERFQAITPGKEELQLLEVRHELHGVTVHGVIGSPKQTRRDRRHQYFFANGRPIIARPLTFALQEAYKGLIMTQQFPLAALFIDLPGEEIDVNVHPTKEEVRFRNESLAAGAIHRGAVEALRKADIVPRFQIPSTPGEKYGKAPSAGSSSLPQGRAKAIEPTRPPDFFKPNAQKPPNADKPIRQADLGLQPRAERQEEAHEAAPPEAPSYADETAQAEASLIEQIKDEGATPRVLAQIERTYILADAPGMGVLLVDQHAAHEKILYLKYQKQRRRSDIQDLMVPFTYEAAPSERAALEALCPILEEEGFTTEHFGGGTFVVQSVPVAFEKVDVTALLRDLLDEVGDGNLKAELKRVKHKIGAMAACRAAVKAGDHLSTPEMQALLDDVLKTEEALRCPHGRPTLLLLTRDQLDRQFGRLG